MMSGAPPLLSTEFHKYANVFLRLCRLMCGMSLTFLGRLESLPKSAFQADRRGLRPHFVPLGKGDYRGCGTDQRRPPAAKDAASPLEKGDKCRNSRESL